jgi:hypothetical protein
MEMPTKQEKNLVYLPLTGSFFVAFFLYKAKKQVLGVKSHDERRED